MKARLIAIFLSFIVIPLSSHAENEPQKIPAKQVIVKGKINLNTADVNSLTGSFKGIGKNGLKLSLLIEKIIKVLNLWKNLLKSRVLDSVL